MTAQDGARQLAFAFLPQTATQDAAGDWTPSPRSRLTAVQEAAELLDTDLAPGSDGTLAAASAHIRALARAQARLDNPRACLRHGYTRSDTMTETSRRAHSGYFAVDALSLRHKRFDGGSSPRLQREVFLSGDAVSVLPWDPDRDLVLLVEQWRAGPHVRGDAMPWVLEAVAGRCDAEETPEETARREAREEAGLILGRMERITGYYSTPGIATEFMTSFVGEADLAAAGGVHGLENEGEDIRAVVVSFARAMEGIADGEIANAPAILSLLWLSGARDRLAAQWRGAG